MEKITKQNSVFREINLINQIIRFLSIYLTRNSFHKFWEMKKLHWMKNRLFFIKILKKNFLEKKNLFLSFDTEKLDLNLLYL